MKEEPLMTQPGWISMLTAAGQKLRGCVGTALITGLAVSLSLSAAAQTEKATGGREMVRWDWYFRESLQAIDDWERILAGQDTELSQMRTSPIFPVPNDGTETCWPNPIPRLLLPPQDAERQYRVRTIDGKIMLAVDGQAERAIEADKPVQAYKHPGGGGKDQWYHTYDRRFDRLSGFVPRTAPFAVTLASAPDFQRGANQLELTVRSAADAVQSVKFDATLFDVDSQRKVVKHAIASQTLELAPKAAEKLACSFDLTQPGGGLVILRFDAQGLSCSIPLLSHVEDVPAVLGSIMQILDDAPDAQAEAEYQQLTAAIGSGGSNAAGGSRVWRESFERASGLRDRLLLKRLDFARMLFIKRKPFYSEQPFMDAHHCYNRPGGEICCLEPVRPDGKVTPIVNSLGAGIYRDLTLDWSADRFVFAFGNGSDRVGVTTRNVLRTPDSKPDYDIYEAGADGSGVRQLTATPKNDCEPFYLPDGRVGFTSDRPEHYVMCGSDIHAANLFVMNGDGSNVRQLSSNVFNEFNPSVLPDGRIIYDRWEYNERSVTSLHDLFTMHPDGTHVAPYYGNATFRPNVIMFPRAVPGSSLVMALFTGHHGQTHGPIGLIDVRRGVDGDDPITLLTPGVPVIGEKIQDSRRGWYSDPQPLSESTYLCSYTPTVLPWIENSWGIYVGDRHGNLALVYRDSEISCQEPVPLVRRPRPPVLESLTPSASDENSTATLLMVDVYEGMPDVPRGSAKYLRVLEDVPRKGVPTGGVICTSGTQIYTVKRILGTVPIEQDGSAHFRVPADRNVYFEVLDENKLEIQRMRSVVCLKPQERRTCMGCHESRTSTPVAKSATAFVRPPDTPQPPPWNEATISFLRDVQPVINDRCAKCHTYDRYANGVLLTDDLTDQFTVAYEELLPFLNVANAMRWDNPEDVFARPPFTYGSSSSPLMKLLKAGHYDVKLTADEWLRLATWIDANAVYYDRYECDPNNRKIFVGEVRNELDAVYSKRCSSCHGEKDEGRHGNWWLSMNRRDPARSRALMAPLAREAGGWQRCDGTVFQNTNDPDFQQLKAALVKLSSQMSQQPRADLLSIAGTSAESQQVAAVAPPADGSPDAGTGDADDKWVSLCELPWSAATAGWTRNQDGKPRRNKDVEDKPLRAGKQIYRRGIGTHAPSEIVCDLDGKFERFAATVAGAESNGTVSFQVYGDDRLLYDSGVMRGLRDVRKIDVATEGVRRLKLVVTDGGDGINSDEANWADARVLKMTETPPAEKKP